MNNQTFFLMTLSTFLVAAVLVPTAIATKLSVSEPSSQVDSNVDKRQLVPLPRIGRSVGFLDSMKRQAFIPAPRIGRRSMDYVKSYNSRSEYCNVNPEKCENVDMVGGYHNGMDSDLIDPIDIQLRAAFIPRLGKRGNQAVQSSENGNSDSATSSTQNDIESSLENANTNTKSYLLDPEMLDEDIIRQQQQRALYRYLIEQKRAIPYTPRIGRAVFAPRIGKKANFVPRIG